MNDIIDDNSYNLFLNALSKKKDFILNIKDKDFNLMIENKYFKENPRFEIEEIKYPRLLLIKDNKLTNKAINTFKNIFDLFSINGKMNKEQSINYFTKCGYDEWVIEEYKINKLFLYDKDKDGFIFFEDFIKYFYDLINQDLNGVWDDLEKLGYNNYLNENYDLDYLKNNKEEFEESSIIFNNFIQLTNLQINKLSLCFKIDKIFIDYLKKKDILINIKEINISLFNVKQFIELNIICPNTEELNLYIYEEDPYEINNIFSNIITLKLYIFKSFDLIDFMDNNNKKIKNLEIYYKCDEYIKSQSKIILENIKNLRIEGNIFIYNNFKFPNLEYYYLNIENIENIKFEGNDDYDLINIFLMKNKFILKDLINIPNKLKNIKYLNINIKKYSFIYDKIKNYFEFKLYDEYLNCDLLIDEKEISKYKKIKIEGLNKLNKEKKNIEIIEDKDINLCDINLNIYQNKYYIKDYKNIRSIYCEEEIQNINFISIIEDIINKNGFINLKYINLRIGNISDNLLNILSKLIKNSKNLKGLILRLNNQNISYYLSLIEDLKKLKILNIITNNDENEENLLKNYPKLKERKYCFEEFKINKKDNIECIYNIKDVIKILIYIKMKKKKLKNILKYI